MVVTLQMGMGSWSEFGITGRQNSDGYKKVE